MPYIREELRPVFDSAVQLAFLGKWAESADRIIFGIKDLSIYDSDACLNYTFSRLLRDMPDLKEAEIVMQRVIFAIFIKEHERYIKYERVMGLLGAIAFEFSEREWRPEAKVVLGKLLTWVISEHYIPYEKRKRIENGDLPDAPVGKPAKDGKWRFEATFKTVKE